MSTRCKMADGLEHILEKSPSTSTPAFVGDSASNDVNHDSDVISAHGQSQNSAKSGEGHCDISLTSDMQENAALMTWEGFVYRRDGVGKTCARSWWRCIRNRQRGQRACLGRATVINGTVKVREEHCHGPDSTQSNYIPPHVTRTQRKDKYLQAAVKGFLSMADQGLLQSGHTRVPKRHMCDMCHLTFAIARVLETHKMLEHQVSPGWTCDECGMQFLQSLSYKLHMVRSHKPYPCGFPGCLASYGNKADLTVHAMSHKDEQPQVLEVDEEGNPKTKRRPVFKCHLCPAEYPHMCKLRYHMRKHTGERPFKCSECSSSFQTSSQRLGHIRRTHIRVRKHLCDLCGKKFKDSRTLREHSGTHSGVKPYSCPVCSRGFSKRAAMFVHIRQHTGEKPYVCDQCGQSFTVRVSLRTHLKSKHNIIVDTGTFKRREDDPGDNSIPLIGRPKRKDAEKQLSLVAKSRASQGQNELRLEHSHSGCNSANSADSESGTSVPSLSNRSSESTRCQNSFSHGSCTPVQPEPKREQSLLPDVRTVTLNPVPFYETNLPMYSSVFQVGDNSDGPVEERAALGQEDLQSRALVGSASGVSNTSSSVSSVVYNGYPVKPPKY